MKIIQTIRLGHKSLSMYKIYSILLIVVFGVAFAGFSWNFFSILKTENDAISEELKPTNGKVLVYMDFCNGVYDKNGEGCETPTNYDKHAQELAKKYRGEQIGAKITYKNSSDRKVEVIAERAAKYLVSKPTYYAPDETIPIVASEGYKEDSDFFVLGNFKKKDEFYLVMDNTSTVMNYLILNGYSMTQYEPVIAFENLNNAYNYYKNEGGSELFAGALEAKKEHSKIREEFLSVFSAFAVAAIVVILIVYGFILSLNKKTSSLYRLVGATKKDVFLIHLSSLIEIVFFILAFSLPFLFQVFHELLFR